MTGAQSRVARTAAGLAIGALAGWLFLRLGTPIPWMLGPLFAMGILRVAGAPFDAPFFARYGGQWIIGTSLALYFTPTVVHEVAGLWPLLAAGAMFAIVVGYVSGLALASWSGLDRTTAIFASVPGGAAEMAALGERHGARVDRVAAAQSLRIVVVVATIPALFALSGVHGADRFAPIAIPFDSRGFAVLMLATLAASAVAQVIRLPNAFVLGSLAMAIPLTASGVELSSMPTPIANAGQCLLGCALGSRFGPDFMRGAHRFVAAALASILLSIVLSAAFGVLLAYASGRNVATVILGTAPGGIAEMCVTAKALDLGVPLVTAFHVTRVVVLLLVTAPMFRRLRRWSRRRVEPEE